MRQAATIISIFWSAMMIFWSGCGAGHADEAVFTTVEKGGFEIVIPAFGELNAVTSTPITVPPQLRGSQTLAWLQEENTFVRKDDVVIRLDAQYYREQIQKEEFEIKKLNLEIGEKGLGLEKEKHEIEGELGLTAIERELADLYGAKDEQIFSRNQIIEDAINLEFLGKKTAHFQGKKQELEKKSNAELELLELKRKTHKTKLDQYTQALEALDIKAPHDGYFIYERSYRGEKPQLGMSVWGGRKIANLPNLDRMEAKVFVLESEAAGLKEGLACSVILDCSPQRTFGGKVVGIDTIAKPLEKESPLKYFEVKISLDETDKKIMKPGNQVRATIYVQKLEKVLSVPNQALIFSGNETFVLVRGGESTVKRKVETGVRSLTRTVITTGLNEGEAIILGENNEEDGRL